MNPRRRRHNKRARVMARRVEVARIYRKHWREAHRAIVAERIAIHQSAMAEVINRELMPEGVRMSFDAREGLPP